MNQIESSIANLSLSTSRIDQLSPELLNAQQGSKKTGAKDSESAVHDVASDFETVFLSLLLKEMRNTLDKEEGGLFGSESSDTMGGMFDMFMGQHLSESQPLGIANAIETYMNRAVVK